MPVAEDLDAAGPTEPIDAERDWRARTPDSGSAATEVQQRPELPAAAPMPAPQRPAAPALTEPSMASAGAGQDATAKIEATHQTGGQEGSGSGQPDGGRAEADVQMHAAAGPEASKTNATDFAELVANARSPRTAHHAAAPQQIAVHIQRAAADGQDRLTLQLRPLELGRIDVQLEFGKDGGLRALVTADNAGTLDMLQRDARGLERALQEAGLKTDANGLSFSLRDQGGQAQREQMQERGRNAALRIASDGAVDAPATVAGAPALMLGPGRVDVRV